MKTNEKEQKVKTSYVCNISAHNLDKYFYNRIYEYNSLLERRRNMFSNKDKIYLQTSDIPNLKRKIDKAIELGRELSSVLNDLENYKLELEINTKKEET